MTDEQKEKSSLSALEKPTGNLVTKYSDNIISLIKDIYLTLDAKRKLQYVNMYDNYLMRLQERVSKVKTIFERQQAISIYDIYVPIGLEKRNDIFGLQNRQNSRNIISVEHPTFESLTSISSSICITGLGGSGKTILMRYLCLDCIVQGGFVPIFIEVRRITLSNLTILEILLEHLESNGLKISYQYLKLAIDKGHFAFFFDGVDELPYDQKNEIESQVTYLSRNFPRCPVIASSRPDASSVLWLSFTELSICKMSIETAKNYLRKSIPDVDLKKSFFKIFTEDFFSKNRSFTSNPLLLSIMFISFIDNSDISNNKSLFYKQAYEALYGRHDTMKGGYKRKLRTGLNIREFAQLFSYFSLITYSRNMISFSELEFHQIAESCISRLDLTTTTDHFLHDLVTGTCLLIEEGMTLTYTHRSFQEYFVALYILDAPENIGEQLLEQVVLNRISDNVISYIFEEKPWLVENSLLVSCFEEITQDYYSNNLTPENYLDWLFNTNHIEYIHLTPPNFPYLLRLLPLGKPDISNKINFIDKYASFKGFRRTGYDYPICILPAWPSYEQSIEFLTSAGILDGVRKTNHKDIPNELIDSLFSQTCNLSYPFMQEIYKHYKNAKLKKEQPNPDLDSLLF